jgi:hypothetical protein
MIRNSWRLRFRSGWRNGRLRRSILTQAAPGKTVKMSGSTARCATNASHAIVPSVREARVRLEAFRRQYNEERSHSRLGYQTTSKFKPAWYKTQASEPDSHIPTWLGRGKQDSSSTLDWLACHRFITSREPQLKPNYCTFSKSSKSPSICRNAPPFRKYETLRRIFIMVFWPEQRLRRARTMCLPMSIRTYELGESNLDRPLLVAWQLALLPVTRIVKRIGSTDCSETGRSAPFIVLPGIAAHAQAHNFPHPEHQTTTDRTNVRTYLGVRDMR